MKNDQSEMALRFQQGDESALCFFYEEFHAALSLYANRWMQDRSIAEEIASTAFIKIWKMHWKLSEHDAIRAYLYKIVQRDCVRALKQETARHKRNAELQVPDVNNETPLHQLIRAEVYRNIYAALKELSPGSRTVLTMHYLDGKTTGEIARELKLSPSTIKTQKMRGLEALRKAIPRPLTVWPYFFYIFFTSL